MRSVESLSNVDEGITMIKARLCFKKVLLVLDDVDNSSQLEALAGDHNWFSPGSRIIITTREKHLLGHGMDALYELRNWVTRKLLNSLVGVHLIRTIPKNIMKHFQTLWYDMLMVFH